MIKGIGIDAVELARIKELIENKPQFIQRILTEKESELFFKLPKRQIEFLGDGMLVKKLFESLGNRNWEIVFSRYRSSDQRGWSARCYKGTSPSTSDVCQYHSYQ